MSSNIPTVVGLRRIDVRPNELSISDERAEPTTNIIESVAAATDRPVRSLAPLAESLDPAALDLLSFGHGRVGPGTSK